MAGLLFAKSHIRGEHAKDEGTRQRGPLQHRSALGGKGSARDVRQCHGLGFGNQQRALRVDPITALRAE
jgi:hypothetical protein